MEENERLDEEMGDEVSSNSSKRIRTSRVWEVFERRPMDKDGRIRAKCYNCTKLLVADSGTSNMSRHIMTCLGKEGESSSRHPSVDQKEFHDVLSKSILRHNYPLSVVEHEGTREVHKFSNPTVSKISRNTAKADLLQIHKLENEKFKKELELVPGRICLTSDLWTSRTSDGYMCVTAHYVDRQWKLQKKILIFRHIPTPHTGDLLGDYLLQFLVEWGIDRKVFSITLDNASNNEGMVKCLKGYLRETNSLIADGNYIQVRCAAHILNLIVQDDLKSVNVTLTKIRECVKYVKASEARKQLFAKCVRLAGLKSNLQLKQNVVTRWNSTYLMLKSDLEHRMAFFRLQAQDSMFKACNFFPSRAEWSHIEKLTEILAPFYEITTLFFGSSYPTANLYFPSVRKIQ